MKLKATIEYEFDDQAEEERIKRFGRPDKVQRHLDILNAFREEDWKKVEELYNNLPYDNIEGYHEVENINHFMTDFIQGNFNYYCEEIYKVKITDLYGYIKKNENEPNYKKLFDWLYHNCVDIGCYRKDSKKAITPKNAEWYVEDADGFMTEPCSSPIEAVQQAIKNQKH